MPGSFGCASVVFAAIAIDAPSWAALNAIAKPMPREPPVINIRLPASDIISPYSFWLRSS